MPKLALSIPNKGKILVSVGQQVKEKECLAEYEDKETIFIDLARHLGVKPVKTYSFLVKKMGDSVVSGEALALKKGLLGRKVLRSPVSGTLVSFEEQRGILAIKPLGESRKLPSPFDGVVSEVIEQKTICITFEGKEFDAKQAQGEKYGRLQVLNKDQPVDIFAIEKDRQNTVLVGFSWPESVWKKAWALDCGVVGVRINGYLEKNSLSFMIVGKDTFDEIIHFDGHQAVISGKEKKLLVQT